MPQIAVLKILFLFRASFYNSLALLGAVGHPPGITSLHHHHWCWTSLTCSSSRSPGSPLAWTAPVSVNVVYLKASMPYCWTCSLGPKIFASRMSASDTELVEPLSLVKVPPSPLYDLNKVSSSIWNLVFFYFARI